MKVGIVGLPNAGKSSLFRALTGVADETATYPFTRIEPNVAVVPVAEGAKESIAAARNDGSLNKISERWLKAPLGDPEHPQGIKLK